MSTLQLSPKNPFVLAALGIGAFWLLSQRRANAATLPGQPSRASQSPTARSYLYSPAVASQYAAYGQGRIGAAAQPSAVSQGLSLASQVLGMFRGSSSGGIATGYNPGTLGTGVSAEADLSSGEAQAAEYYSTHADEFIANPVVITPDMTDAAILQGMSEY